LLLLGLLLALLGLPVHLLLWLLRLLLADLLGGLLAHLLALLLANLLTLWLELAGLWVPRRHLVLLLGLAVGRLQLTRYLLRCHALGALRSGLCGLLAREADLLVNLSLLLLALLSVLLCALLAVLLLPLSRISLVAHSRLRGCGGATDGVRLGYAERLVGLCDAVRVDGLRRCPAAAPVRRKDRP